MFILICAKLALIVRMLRLVLQAAEELATTFRF